MRIERVTFAEASEAMYEEMLAHWNEVPFGPFDMTLALNNEAYVIAEKEGHALFYLAYDEDKPVAYLSVFASEMIQHKGVMQAVTDAFYVAPDYRKGGVFGKLLEFVEQDVKSFGIRFLTLGVNPMYKGNTAQFLEHVGYCKTEISYTKEL